MKYHANQRPYTYPAGKALSSGLDLSGLDVGTYFLRARSSDGNFALLKVIVQK